MTMRPAGESVTKIRISKNSSGERNGYGLRLRNDISLDWSNGNGYDKEDGLKNGHNDNGKDHLKSGPQWSEGWGAPHLLQHKKDQMSVSAEAR